MELPSLWGTRVQAEILLMSHPGKDSVGLLLHTPEPVLDPNEEGMAEG